MQNQRDRIIIDTNLWISYLLTKDFSSIDLLVANAEIDLIFSEELIDEIVEVTQRSKFKKYISEDDVQKLFESIKNCSILIKVKSNVQLCRDAKDNFLLSLAVDGHATHLITGDKDLLILKKIKNTKIETITEYINSK